MIELNYNTNEPEQFIYGCCPECGKTIKLAHNCIIKNHKKDNKDKCPGSGYRIPGYRHRMMTFLYGDNNNNA